MRPPWRAPHISTGSAGLIGSWSSKSGLGVVPGEWTLAHLGVLFLDEWSEFSRSALEACRVPMESGSVALARAAGSLEMPAKALLIAALNPCPCGRLTEEYAKCYCSPGEVRRYLKKLSGPVADRFSIHIELGNERWIEEKSDKTSHYDNIIDYNDTKCHKSEQNSSQSDLMSGVQNRDNLDVEIENVENIYIHALMHF